MKKSWYEKQPLASENYFDVDLSVYLLLLYFSLQCRNIYWLNKNSTFRVFGCCALQPANGCFACRSLVENIFSSSLSSLSITNWKKKRSAQKEIKNTQKVSTLLLNACWHTNGGQLMGKISFFLILQIFSPGVDHHLGDNQLLRVATKQL